jgi:hypothetical protein
VFIRLRAWESPESGGKLKWKNLSPQCGEHEDYSLLDVTPFKNSNYLT